MLTSTHAPAWLLWNPTVIALDLSAPSPGTAPAALDDHEQALAWYRAEQAVLTATVARAHAAGFDDHAWQLSAVLAPFLLRAGAWREWEEVSRAALAAAERSGHRDRQAHAHRRLGQVHRSEDRQPEAHAQLRLALDLFDALGDRPRQGGTEAARTAWQDALTILDDLQHRDAVAVRGRLDALTKPRLEGPGR
ncbi:hypothetical protein [Kitasatospora aureofaciens]|uniref:hypothetical protein n=1 Tax=Kitasatospora aureofaciens TaxID=1894 RepID=UPI001C478AC3|nr:hypothetical protein [Kitasatospora aureofaciens]MBV6701026.1 hypothetical protein [Kitasatospora aureofaciens]